MTERGVTITASRLNKKINKNNTKNNENNNNINNKNDDNTFFNFFSQKTYEGITVFVINCNSLTFVTVCFTLII